MPGSESSSRNMEMVLTKIAYGVLILVPGYNRGAYPEHMSNWVDQWWVSQRQVDSQKDVQDALVAGRAPAIEKQVSIGFQTPAGSTEEAHHKVDDEADHCRAQHTRAVRGTPHIPDK